MTTTSLYRRHLLLAGAGMLAPFGASAQDKYPAKPVQLIHGFGAGGNADVVARLVAQKLQEPLRQPVVVDIKSGAGGIIASNFVAKAAPDGCTLAMLTGAHTVSAALRKDLPYDAVKDFAFISTVSSFPFVIAVRAEHPARTLAELLDIARKGKVSFSSVGVGSTQHMVGELLGAAAGVQLLHVPYRGGGAPVQAVIAGDVDVLADTLTVATPHIQSGRLRALAVTSAAPWPSLPGVPSASATLPGFEVRSWLGLAAPAHTPDAIVQRLNAQVRQLLQQPDVQKVLANAGSAASPSSPLAMQEMVRAEIERWRDVVVRRGIKVE
ncbi:Tripartite-type tricarboxylate transporter, receptor component TctC [Variovorax sp. OK605]|jgi:tripartite-type tricarboxylate transporter receptor subunit TctC|uniref:tripartite tricarboxylate transporter substrate binding protein n=1 Tax=unclassified Variovorax TaxID=663243 RepID=UPI0008CD6CD6|nr:MULTISPECIES: tripartite tricarboxylate transporter substrate binding protein [unclassified Variovorax]SEK12553.1 Tripartite-type tricarboxylate transporter, receptor component TctC [Variovorax sp. OK202]SFD82255.1 Tripartite-type tricarboxylate transporter, receptor component TctC [Variovorax sp. OK212]SFP60281.1 Tripartite-type tricarboxylate transporter, receptor component TctC [Variovorax sp. OK605]